MIRLFFFIFIFVQIFIGNEKKKRKKTNSSVTANEWFVLKQPLSAVTRTRKLVNHPSILTNACVRKNRLYEIVKSCQNHWKRQKRHRGNKHSFAFIPF